MTTKRPRIAQTTQLQTAKSKLPPAVFPIVGIGCSAGGLEALEKFFSEVPADCGMAFVVIQHLDPKHTSSLPELIGRAAHLPVLEAHDRMKVQPGSIYVIPPNSELSLLHDTLHLLEPVSSSGLRLPVDLFLRTLAEDRHEGAIGVILSGMGSDGMLGLRAIKEQGGLALVQDPAEAKSDGMPKSAINAGLADIVAPASTLPARITAYLRRPLRLAPGEQSVAPTELSALEKIIILLRDRSGSDFSDYKTSTLYRRIERRTALHQLGGIAAYVNFLRENPQELDLLFKELLIGVTNFFRDPAVWQTLCDTALPTLFARHPGGASLRAWVPACSSGEEAYTLAMVFKEALAAVKPEGRFTLQIYATDLDADAIDKARKGLYPGNISVDVTPTRLARFFMADEAGYRVSKSIRDMVVFAPQNIISDPPFTNLDILACRNLLIYFGPELQEKLIRLFHYALNRNGLLVLGSAETVGSHNDLFATLDSRARIFQRLDLEHLPARLDFPAGHHSPILAKTTAEASILHDSLETLTDQLVQQHYAPAAVLVSNEGDILYISGRTGKYLEPAAGKVNINIHAMARVGLREALPGVIRNALHQPEPIRLRGLKVGTNGGTQVIDLIVQGLTDPEPLRGRVLMVFQDMPMPPGKGEGRRKASPATTDLESELQRLRETLRVAHEGMQTSVEEYKSANEELQSANEELQSANEELTTSKEEMQSLNEELQTVNAELQSKVEELTSIRNDMANLLNSTEIATVFLDNGLQLRSFSAQTTHLFKLISGDVGRPLSDIVSVLDYPSLMSDALEVLRTLVFHEQQVTTHDGRWIQVRIMPYRTLDNIIDGVVITFFDITQTKQLEAKLRRRSNSTLTKGQA